MYNFHAGYGMMGSYGAGLGLPLVASVILLVAAWSLVWKGLALWRAAKRGDRGWFIAFLFINTIGILEIIYLFAITGAKMADFTKPTTQSGQGNDPHAGHDHN